MARAVVVAACFAAFAASAAHAGSVRGGAPAPSPVDLEALWGPSAAPEGARVHNGPNVEHGVPVSVMGGATAAGEGRALAAADEASRDEAIAAGDVHSFEWHPHCDEAAAAAHEDAAAASKACGRRLALTKISGDLTVCVRDIDDARVAWPAPARSPDLPATAKPAGCMAFHDTYAHGSRGSLEVPASHHGRPVRVLVAARRTSRYLLTGARRLDDVPLVLDTPSGEYNLDVNAVQYFTLTLAAGESKAVTFILTPLEGDADIFVSALVQHPTSGDHTWASRTTDRDVVNIAADDPNACHTQDPCVYHVGVEAFGGSPARFSLLAATPGATVTLVDGQPEFAEVGNKLTNQYRFVVPADAHMAEITIMAYYGDPDMYIRLDGGTPSSKPGEYLYSAISQEGEDIIRLDRGNQQFIDCQDKPGGCTITIAVFGYSEAHYVITAVADDTAIELVDGQPYVDSVDAWNYTYFKFTSLRVNAPLIFTLTPYAGDPDMFVSLKHVRPSSRSHEWTSFSTDVDQIVIEADDPKKAAGGCTTICDYYVAVRGFSTPAVYSLLAYTVSDADDPVRLAEGKPQVGTVGPATMTYYRFWSGTGHYDIEFIATATSGSVQLYVTNELDPLTGKTLKPTVHCTHSPVPGSACVPVSQTNVRWSSLSSYGRGRVTISHTDPNFRTNAMYYIGVWGADTDTTSGAGPPDGGNNAFSIVAVTSSGTITLRQGVPLQDQVDKGNYEYYRMVLNELDLPTFSDVHITLTSFFGDADIYVAEGSRTIKPTKTNYDWRSNSVTVNDAVVIQDAQMKDCQARRAQRRSCELWIGVYGFTNASYTILAAVADGTPTTLLDGTPQQGQVAKGEYAYYTAHVPVGLSDSYTVSVVPTSGDPDLFINSTAGPNVRASRYSYTHNSVLTGGEDRVVVEPNDPLFRADMDISIAVWGYSDTEFSVLFTTAQAIVTLRDGSPAQGRVAASHYKYYLFHVDAGAGDITITCTPLTGDPDLYVVTETGSMESLPTIGSSTWSAVDIGGDTIVIPTTDPNYCDNCNYVIGVHSFLDSSYTVTASASPSTLIYLVDGQPQSSQVARGAYRYFTFFSSANSLQVQVSGMDASVDAYITNAYRPDPNNPDAMLGARPTAGSYLWSTTGAGASGDAEGTVTITSSDPHWSNTLNRYTIGVTSSTGGGFRISARSSTTAQVLQIGVPLQSQYLQAAGNAHYVVNMDQTDRDLDIIVTALGGGDPDVLMDGRGRVPTCQYVEDNHWECFNYTWAYHSYGSDTLNVSATDPCMNAYVHLDPPCQPKTDWHKGQYNINVFAFTETHYSILALLAGGHTALTFGVPQRATTALVAFCTDRDSDSGACPSGGNTKHAMASLFTFSQPVGSGRDVTMTIANDNYDQVPNLDVYISVCTGIDCTVNNQYPSAEAHAFKLTTGQNGQTAVTTLAIPDTSLYCPTSAGGNCQYFVAVTTPDEDCHLFFAHCKQVTFQITVATDDSTVVIPHDCSDGKLCVEPEEVILPGSKKTYKSYLGDASAKKPMLVRLESCLGNPVLYGCNVGNASSVCHTPSGLEPGPGNADLVMVSNQGATTFYQPNAYGTWYFRVTNEHASGPASFQLDVASGDPVMLHAKGVVTATVLDASLNVQVTAPLATLNTNDGKEVGAQGGMFYSVYFLEQSTNPTFGDQVITTACGVKETQATVGHLLGTDTLNTRTYSAAKLTAGATYTVVVTVLCDETCMGNGKSAEEAAYPPIKVTLTAPTPAPGGLGGGWVFLIVVLVLGAIGGGFFAFKKWQQSREGGGGGDDVLYAAM